MARLAPWLIPLIAAVPPAAPLPLAGQSPAPIRVPFVLDTFPNGLRLIVHEDHSVPVATELERTKQYLALRLPGTFETTGQVGGQIANLLVFDLPFTWFDDYVRRIMAIKAEAVRRVARAYIHPDSMTVVVVGDVQKIRPGIERLNLGPVILRKP